VLSIPAYFRNHKNIGNIEKFLLRFAFSKTLCGDSLLPDSVLWRKKEAFSDGVSSKGRSLYQILQYHIAATLCMEDANIDTEKFYYKKIFDQEFPNCASLVPYYWMPKYTNATDPSARTLALYETHPFDKDF
jgi:asparagine synthase (glutamine-hydrolysing)